MWQASIITKTFSPVTGCGKLVWSGSRGSPFSSHPSWLHMLTLGACPSTTNHPNARACSSSKAWQSRTLIATWSGSMQWEPSTVLVGQPPWTQAPQKQHQSHCFHLPGLQILSIDSVCELYCTCFLMDMASNISETHPYLVGSPWHLLSSISSIIWFRPGLASTERSHLQIYWEEAITCSSVFTKNYG